MGILDSLKENKSIQIKKSAKDWEEAIRLLMKPLEESNAVSKDYAEAIISRTKEIGPFYVIAPKVAMPHERSECGALKNAFTFMTLENPVIFPGGEEVDILIGFSAIDKEVHIVEAIPQVVSLLDDEDDENFDKIRNLQNEAELEEYITKTLK